MNNNQQLNEKINNMFQNIIDNLNNEKENLLNIINSEKKTPLILDKKVKDGLILYYDKTNNINYDSNGNKINNN